MASTRDLPKDNLHGVVDMGSNGIRFSISDLSQPTARIMPTIFQDRAGISLYEAQFSNPDGNRGPIPAGVIEDAIARLVRFKSTCEDFGVPPRNVHVLATEATRTASNADDFISKIKAATGWDTRMLLKEEEGRIGALGVASSFSAVEGLVMDLGGGSTQITWMIAKDGVVETSPKGSVSLPYGAVALMNRLAEARKQGSKAEQELREEMKANIQSAYSSLEVPEPLLQTAHSRGGFDLYLCGGGFRGWGYLLMSQSKIHPYPIPIINGFRASAMDFHDTDAVLNITSTADSKIFRVSKRRASQVPAVAFLITVLAEALPSIHNIQFCQGGVREGFLYDSLEKDIRKQDPLIVATASYAPPSAGALYDILISVLPSTSSPILSRQAPPSFTHSFLLALTHILFAHSCVTRESKPAAALYCTTTGILASANSLSHLDRALLALVLSERWTGDLAPTEQAFQERLRQLVSMQEAWWCRYLGRVAALIGDIYPAGVVLETQWRIRFQAGWQQVVKKKQGTVDIIVLGIIVNHAVARAVNRDSLEDAIERIEKIGKKKNWIKAAERIQSRHTSGDYGIGVEVEIRGEK
ncbi:Ppx/GppA phosphatase family domain containing protein [Elaphomyces granulatus]